MKIEDFPESNTVIAKDQPEYQPIFAHRFRASVNGRIAFCWSLSWRERVAALLYGRVWQQVLTFNKPLQPQLLTVEKPYFEPDDADGV